MWLNVLRAGSLFYVSTAVVLCMKNISLFSLHPIMMSIAFILLMTEGILFLYPKNSFSRKFKKTTKTRLHWIMQTVAVVAVGSGFLSIFFVKISNGKKHFTTWHGLLGLITCVFVIFTSLMGVTTLYKLKFASVIKPFRFKLIHRYFGGLTLILGLICIGFGYSSTWASNQLDSIFQVGVIFCLLPLSAAVLYILKDM